MLNIDTWAVISILLSALALSLTIFALQLRKYPPAYDFGLKSNAENVNSQSIAVLRTKIENLELMLIDRDARIKELRKEIEEIKQDRDKKIQAQDEVIAALRERISFLERLLYQTRNVTPNTSHEHVDSINPQTLLITSNDLIQRADEISLNRARINYRRIVNATLEKIKEEFRRRRSEGRMYKYIIFSAHMDESGIQLYGGDVLDKYWLNTNLNRSTELVILNGCDSIAIADSLAGVVGTVISISEKVSNDDASSFLTSFWKSFASGKSISDAFFDAKQNNPSMSPYVDIQRSSDKESYFTGD